jgi:hypothetical protein
MARYNFGQGQYRYFKYPLPNLINTLRKQSYDFLLPLARQWAYNLKQDLSYPDFYADYLRLCHQAGQARPTPLILRYEQGDYNCLHQDHSKPHPSKPLTRFYQPLFVLKLLAYDVSKCEIEESSYCEAVHPN